MTDRLQSNDPGLLASLRQGEGLRLIAYPDPKSGGDPWTNGYGSTVGVKKGDVWTKAEAEAALIRDAATAIALLDRNAAWWRNLNLPRQRVLAEMCFNMGWRSADGKHGLSTFVHTLEAMRNGFWTSAAAGMLASQWALDVGSRARRLAAVMQAGQ